MGWKGVDILYACITLPGVHVDRDTLLLFIMHQNYVQKVARQVNCLMC